MIGGRGGRVWVLIVMVGGWVSGNMEWVSPTDLLYSTLTSTSANHSHILTTEP